MDNVLPKYSLKKTTKILHFPTPNICVEPFTPVLNDKGKQLPVPLGEIVLYSKGKFASKSSANIFDQPSQTTPLDYTTEELKVLIQELHQNPQWLDPDSKQCKFTSSKTSLEKLSDTSKLVNNIILSVEDLCHSLFKGCESLEDACFSWNFVTSQFFSLQLTSKILLSLLQGFLVLIKGSIYALAISPPDPVVVELRFIYRPNFADVFPSMGPNHWLNVHEAEAIQLMMDDLEKYPFHELQHIRALTTPHLYETFFLKAKWEKMNIIRKSILGKN
eukprot:Lithocolla_globosa_v1_NODE_761_length_3323_cov_18.520808.p2 type:complete len:275 gc:universal NODE_761_length_3323_cov_18.520808:2315-3139(+)